MVLLFISLLFLYQPAANDTTDVQSQVESATVFLSGAEVHRTASLRLQAGTNYLRFSGLSSSLSEETIQLQANSDIVLESISKSTDQNAEGAFADQINQLQTRKEVITDSIAHKEADLAVLDKKLNFLLTNQDLSGSNSKISASEIRQAMDYFSAQFQDIENQRIAIKDDLNRLQQKLREIDNELRKIMAESRRASGMIELAVNAPRSKEVTFNLSYYIPNARWQPSYDVRVENTDEPLSLSYKANITQNTGVDWNNIGLTVSSVQPRSDTSIPSINPIYLSFYEPPRPQPSRAAKPQAQFDMQNLRTAGQSGISWVTGIVRDAQTGEPLPGANVVAKGTGQGGAANAAGRYSFSVTPDAKLLRVTYIGYEVKEVPIYSSQINVSLQGSSAGLNEMVVTGYGSSVGSELRQGQTAFSFEIDNPYTITSGASEKAIAVESYTTPADYNYFAIPKERKEALLTAKLTDWSSLNLLAGDANLFLEQSFVGKTDINPAATDDTLSFSLGTDKGINIDRRQIESFKEKNFFGNKVTETKGWEIPVRNSKSVPVAITIVDQVPVSSNEDINIELQEKSGASFNKSTGKLRWELELAPGQTETLRFVYETTYPSGERLQQSGN